MVLARPRFARRDGVTRADINELVALLRDRAETVLVDGTLQLCRDPDDDVVIETELNGRADVLVTRDDVFKGAPDVAVILAQQGIAVLAAR